MMTNVKISGYQLALLIMGFLFGSTAVLNPTAMAGQDAWLAYILAWVGGFMLIWLYVRIALINPSLTLVEILKVTFGKYLGTVIALLYIWYFLHLAALVLRDFGEHMNVTVFYRTPMTFIISCFALLIAYCLRKGLEVTGRAAEILMPYLFIFVIIIFFLLIPEYDTNNLFPFLEKGLTPVIQVAFGVLTFPFGETVTFLMIFPALYSPGQLKKVSFAAFGVMGFIILGIIVRDLLSLGPDLLTRLVFPPSLSTELTPELQLEPLISVNFLLGGWVKITVCLYAALVGIAQLLGLNDYKHLVLPLVLLAVGLAMWLYEDLFKMMDWTANVYPYYAFPLQFGIPLLILLVAKIRKLA
ncbi:MAG TPA: endospore germination permease [Peptococcaceae bacterium]|nr:endospore germination permease [Peptococcaceae bacterium]